MKFPNAHKGVKNIVIGFILEVVAVVLLSIAAILARPGADAASIATSATFILVGSIITIVAFIFELVGLFQAKKDEGSFSTALWMVLFMFLLAVISAICSFFPLSYVLAKPICDVLVDACRLVMMLSIIGGIANMAEKLNEKEYAANGRTIRMVLAGLFLMGLVLQLLSALIVNPGALKVMFVLGVVGLVAELIADICLVIYLIKAPKKLSK